MFIRRDWTDSDTYDSTFEPAAPRRPAQLTIKLRVALIPRDPTGRRGSVHLAANNNDRHFGIVKDADNQKFACQSWLVSEWVEFKKRLKYMVELSWNNQIILLPPAGLDDDISRQLVSAADTPAHLRCSLEIVRVSEWQQEAAHAVIEAVLQKAPNMGNGAQPHMRGFRSWGNRICDKDVYFEHHRSKHGNKFLYQCTAAHEVGHWLHEPGQNAFEHIDKQYCSAHPDENDDECEYGHTYSTERALMGSGTVATEYEATPWLKRIGSHVVDAGNWKYIHRIDFQHLPARSAGRT
jgi:hypothetical protein